jgi:1-acyl-sn-glycerol-3-phosphate acyltransferase
VSTLIDDLAQFAAGRRAIALVAVWGLAEAILLPVVPDVALCLLALAAPRRAAVLFAAMVAGAVAGSLILHAWASADPDGVARLLLLLPGIDQPMLDGAARAVDGGNLGAFAGFGPGTPVKVYTRAWAADGGSPLLLVLGIVLNRVTRVGSAVLVATLLGLAAPGWLRRHDRQVIAAYAAFWIALYASYLA